MGINFVSEAYKSAEKLAYDYLAIRELLSKLLHEQKYPTEIEAMLLSVYKLFQTNADKLISLYQKQNNVLPINKLLANVEDEMDAVFADSDLAEPLLNEVDATEALIKFLINLETLFLNDAKQYEDSISGFNWNIDSFKKAFSKIRSKGVDYVSYEQIRSKQNEI